MLLFSREGHGLANYTTDPDELVAEPTGMIVASMGRVEHSVRILPIIFPQRKRIGPDQSAMMAEV